MGDVHCFTSATFAYLDRVRVLGETLRAHHPDWHFTLCLPDAEPPGFIFRPEEEPVDAVVRLGELAIPDVEQWTFEHDVIELCTAVKGTMLCKLLEEGAQKVVYLDPDIAVLGNLGDIERLLDEHAIVLTPHQIEPEDDPIAVRDNELTALKYGVFNLGFVAVANTDDGRRFAEWWRRRLLEFCFDDVPNGLFTDQRWCDLAPAYFAGVHVLRDPGYNVASWNLSKRPISIDRDGQVRAGGAVLRFFHFTKVTSIGEVMIDRYSGGRLAVFELLAWYQRRLASHAVDGLTPGWWAYGHYDDGTPISRHERLAYRTDPQLRQRCPHPFLARPVSLRQLVGT